MFCPFSVAAPQFTAVSAALTGWSQDVRWHWLTPKPTCLSDPHASGEKMAAKMIWHMNASHQLSALHYPSLSELIVSWLVWTGHVERIQVVLLQQAWFVSGSGGTVMEVCLNNGASARQVGQVEQLPGIAERDCQVPPGGQILWLRAGSKKQVLLLHHTEGKIHPEIEFTWYFYNI